MSESDTDKYTVWLENELKILLWCEKNYFIFLMLGFEPMLIY